MTTQKSAEKLGKEIWINNALCHCTDSIPCTTDSPCEYCLEIIKENTAIIHKDRSQSLENCEHEIERKDYKFWYSETCVKKCGYYKEFNLDKLETIKGSWFFDALKDYERKLLTLYELCQLVISRTQFPLA